MDNINNSKLRIIPLGGLEAIGMNITAFEFEDSIVVVDCGLSFPTDDNRHSHYQKRWSSGVSQASCRERETQWSRTPKYPSQTCWP